MLPPPHNTKLLVQRKKPKEILFKNNTWSSPPSRKMFSTTTEEATVPIENRIDFYQEQYEICMGSPTQLPTWIKSIKKKGLPIPLTEGYVPPTSRSRLPDFLFSSLSTRPKRKSQLNNFTHDFSSQPSPSAKCSLSTLLKKASDSLSTSYKQVPPLKRQQRIFSNAPPTTNRESANPASNHHRFSFTSSLNRFSLPKSSYHNMTEKYHSLGGSNKEEIVATENESYSKQRRHRFSTPPPLPTPQSHQYQKQKKQQYNISSPTDLRTSVSAVTHKKLRPQSTILPHSPSSIFLDRLRSRTAYCNNDIIGEGDEKQCHQIIQPNILCKKQYYPTTHEDDNMTPPSSPSSTDSTFTPPLVSYDNHRQYMNQRQHLDLFSLPSPMHHTVLSISSSTAAIAKCGKSVTANPQKKPKKKRASLLVTPSLSTIRLISQKSQFLKRQSTLA